eukprot:jgi/Mesen1/4097/ME000215S03375
MHPQKSGSRSHPQQSWSRLHAHNRGHKSASARTREDKGGAAMAAAGSEFKFFLSCDINLPVRFKIDSLSGDLPPPPPEGGPHDAVRRQAVSSGPSPPPGQSQSTPGPNPGDRFDAGSETLNPTPELYVECELFIDGARFGLPMRTRQATMGKGCRWNEWVTLSVKYSDLTANAQLAFTVWDVAQPRCEVAVGGATLPLFGRKRTTLRTGATKLHLAPSRVADGSLPSSTPGKLDRLEKLVSKFDRGELARCDWLDRLAFKAYERMREDHRRRHRGARHLAILVELPTFEHPVVFQEPGGHVATLQPPLAATNELVRVWDPEEGQRGNPSEHKQLKLARMSTSMAVTRGIIIDRDLKPNSGERKQIAAILGQPPTRALSGEERQLLWRFRFSLTADKGALTKFLRCVDWSDAHEAEQAIHLMERWAPIDIADALELLSPAFVSEEVRAYAVGVLQRADDEELKCYLLQLVQALRYERSQFSNLAAFLVSRAVRNFELGNFLHWYVLVEWQEAAYAPHYMLTHHSFVSALQQIRRQNELAAQLVAIMRELKLVRGGAARKMEKLRQILSPQGSLAELSHFSQELRLPLDPKIKVTGVIAAECSVFRSALSPLKLTFRTDSGHKVRIIFKKGDDLRQDQLIVQMVSLMDRLLKKENLDLKLTPYKVLATGADDGMVEFVPSMSLAQVLTEYRTIVKYLQHLHPDERGPFGVSSECLDTFVKSCAGYCVIMHILGVGDRHLDNLLLADDGRLFHIDFGFILGRDPKPFPPPMKLCKEMVEAMGGAESEHYKRFKSYCCEAYNILRKSSNLILNLFHLMAGANIPDIASDPEKGILKLQQKFRLDLDDEAAVQFFQALINESVSALFPQMVETIHRWAQYWR